MVHVQSLEEANYIVNDTQILATGGGGDLAIIKRKIEQINIDQKRFKIQGLMNLNRII